MANNFSHQYSENYRDRLEVLRKEIECSDMVYKEISTVRDSQALVKGVIFMNSSKKLSIFNADGDVELDKTSEAIESYVEEKKGNESLYFIEDESCKIDIEFKCSIFNETLITGMVLGFVGCIENAKFICSKIIYPRTYTENKQRKIDNRRLLILSNVKFNNNFDRILPILDLYLDRFDDVVLLGSVIDKTKNNWDFSKVDRFIKKFAGKLYIVPGLDDPTDTLVPQHPLHPLLFLNSPKIETLSNPSIARIGGKETLFIDGKYVMADFMRYKQNSKPSDCMKSIIKSRLMVPCAPDTLPCKPSNDDSKVEILKCVDIVITGGEKTEIEQFRDKTLVTVPDFNSNGIGVIFNTVNNEVEEIEVKN